MGHKRDEKRHEQVIRAVQDVYITMQGFRGALNSLRGNVATTLGILKRLDRTIQDLTVDVKATQSTVSRLSQRLEAPEDITRYAEDTQNPTQDALKVTAPTVAPEEVRKAVSEALAKAEPVIRPNPDWFKADLPESPFAKYWAEVIRDLREKEDEREHRAVVRDLEVTGPPVMVYEYGDWKINKDNRGVYLIVHDGNHILTTSSYDRARAYVDAETGKTDEMGG
jgi:hypothetical protein